MRAKNFSGIIILVLCFSFIAAVQAWSDVEINEKNFPDDNFREYVRKNFDTDSNGTLRDEEISDAKMVNVNFINIASLKGIEFLTALTDLHCDRNQLRELDVSKNTALKYLNCNQSQLRELNISKNTALTRLYCDSNQLTKLDVSKNTALKWLSCYSNQLRELDISKNAALTELYCGGNQIRELNISKNMNLAAPYCDPQTKIIY